MKKHATLLLLFGFLFYGGCQSNSTQQIDSSNNSQRVSKLTIGYNTNLETMALIYNLSESGDYHFNQIKGPRATLAKALTQQFETYREHDAVNTLNALLDEGFVDMYDVILSLYNTPLPEFQQYANFPAVYYENEGLTAEETQRRFDDFNASIRKFYSDFNLEKAFTEKYKSLYDRIMQEVSTVAPSDSFILEAENYFGYKRDAYEIIVSAFAFNGIGKAQLINWNGNTKAICLVTSNHLLESDSISFEDLDAFNFGYADAKYFQEIGLHELIHTFFHEALKENSENLKLIDSIEYLFTDSLKLDMAKQGYVDWRACFEEHLVRVGEIKIAEKLHNISFIESYKKECIEARKFIYFDTFYGILNQYENQRGIYPNIDVFIPELVRQLQKAHPKTAN